MTAMRENFVSSKYTLTRVVPNQTIEALRPAVERALASQGFGVLTTIDVQATLKKKIDVDTEPYLILGACNPKLAHQALRIEPAIGALLPCNVVLAQSGNDVLVSAVDPKAMFSVVDRPDVGPLADEVRTLLLSALDQLGGE